VADPGVHSALAYPGYIQIGVTELVLRGIFWLTRQAGNRVEFYQRGEIGRSIQDAWEPYLAHIPRQNAADALSDLRPPAYQRDGPAVRTGTRRRCGAGWRGRQVKMMPDSAYRRPLRRR